MDVNAFNPGCRISTGPSPIRTSPGSAAMEDEKAPVSPSGSPSPAVRSAAVSGSEGRVAGQVSQSAGGHPHPAVAPPGNSGLPEPATAFQPPLEEVHKRNFVGQMTVLTGDPLWTIFTFLQPLSSLWSICIVLCLKL